jgi:O-antigen/teichoic acid export membrane protein
VSRLAKDSTITIIARALVLILAMLNSIIIARQLGPTLQGSYNVIVLIMITSTTLFLLSLASANAFLGARHPHELHLMLGNSLVAALILGAVAIIILEALLHWQPIQNYLDSNGISQMIFRPLLFLIPVLLISHLVREVIRANGQIVVYNLLAFLGVFINLCVLVILFSLEIDTLTAAIYAWVSAQTTLAVLAVALAFRAVNFQIGVSWRVFKSSLSFGLRGHGGVITQFLNCRLDVFLIGWFLTPTAIGHYAIATILAERIWEIPTSIRTALVYHVSITEKDPHLMTARVTRVVSLLIGCLSLGLIVLSNPFIRLLYGDDYLPAVAALVLIQPGIWAFSVGKLLSVYIASINRPEIGTLAGLVALIATLILDLALIPAWGIAGAAVASSISYIISTIIITRFFLHMTGLTLAEVVIIQQADIQFVRRLFGDTMKRLKIMWGQV